MKSIVLAFAIVALSSFSLLIATPMFTTPASADPRMDGKANCSGGTCNKVDCPPKTCSRNGTSTAMDARYCSAANCRKK
jgi:hypothetical protein